MDPKRVISKVCYFYLEYHCGRKVIAVRTKSNMIISEKYREKFHLSIGRILFITIIYEQDQDELERCCEVS